MKKAKSRLEVAAEFLKASGPSLITMPGVTEGSTDKIFMLGGGDMIWLAVSDGPEYPVLNIDDLLATKETAPVVLDLFVAELDDNLTANKLFKFENELRKILKTYALPADKVREIKIAFLDAKEAILDESEAEEETSAE